MTAAVEDYYDGSRTFSWLADFIDVPIDQVNFLLTQFTALILAGFLRTFLSPGTVTPATRHVFGLIMGLGLGYFCFGRQAIHLAGLPALCYIAMRTQNPRNIQKVVLTTAMFYLSCVHYHRQMYNYGSYTLDITGPLMVITQKVTSLAYSVHDGLTQREDELTPTQRHQAVKKMPSILEYFSYVFHFQALMAGPVIFYCDYIDFIQGHNLNGSKSLKGHNKPHEEIVLEPSPTIAVIKKVTASLVFAVLFVTFIPAYPIQKLKDEDFLENTTIAYKIWYLIVATMLVRFKYYHAWMFADAICNNSGIGFDGYDENGNAKWDLVSNVDVPGFEISTNLRDSIDNWNKGTNRWLRIVMYDRVKKNKLICTYTLSALWHGFYPGYYFTFANGAFFTLTARTARRTIRPYFLGSNGIKFLYDAITFVSTRILMAYITFTFILLEFIPCVKMYLYLCMFPHVIGLIILLLASRLPKGSSHKKVKEETSNVSQESVNGNARRSM